MLTIGQVSKQAGVSVETIRFYEKQTLIEVPERSEAGYRLYTADAITTVRFIRHAKDLGFTLKEIRELLELSRSTVACCRDIQKKTMGKIDELSHRIHELKCVRDELLKLSRACSDGGDCPSECPILKALYK